MKRLSQALMIGLIAGSITISTEAYAQKSGEKKILRSEMTITPGTSNGQEGSWVQYTEYSYHYNSISDRLAALGANSGLTAADYQALAALYPNSEPSDATLKAQIQALVTKKTKEAAVQKFNSNIANTRIYAYGEAGGLAFRLAQDMVKGQAAAGYSSNNLYFNGSYSGEPYNWATTTGRGWPLEAAMIHNPEFAAAGQTIPKDALLAAWDLVWANVQAHGWSLGDPLVLDINGNKKIDVTGKSAAKYRLKENEVFVAAGAVKFDILGAGKAIHTEWISSGDGFLVDNRKNAARNLLAAGKNFTVRNLFGDTEGYAGGFAMLGSKFDSHAKIASAAGGIPQNLGVIKGKDLDSLLVWVDDGDGVAKPGELHTLKALGISEIRLPASFKKANGEFLEQATYTRNGKRQLIQEVWFAHENAN